MRTDIPGADVFDWMRDAFAVSVAAISGFLVSRIFGLAATAQAVKDMQATMLRLHEENIKAHDDLIERLKTLERYRWTR